MKTLVTKPKQFLFSKNEYDLMREYFAKCIKDAFNAENDFTSVNSIREMFYRWHLNDLIKKFSKARESEVVKVLLNYPEVKTAQAMFQRIEARVEVINIQRRFRI